MDTASSEDLGRLALNCYLGALVAFGRAAVEVCPHIGAPYEGALVRERQRIAFEPTEERLRESLAGLEQELLEFGRRVAEYYTTKSGDVGAILETVAQAVETFETRDQLYRERLGLLVQQMDSGMKSSTGDADLRTVYDEQLGHLRKFCEHLSADGKRVFDHLREDIGAIEERLLRAEAEASIDPLTSLVTRRELERLIRERIPTGKAFSLLLFDIKSLRAVNDRYGRDAGDQVLKQFAARLGAQVRPRDIVARWGGDEFAVVFDCPAAAADARAQQIAQWVSGRYPIQVNEQEWKAEVLASVAVVEYNTGESGPEFIRRANGHIPQGASPAEVEIKLMDAPELVAGAWRTL